MKKKRWIGMLLVFVLLFALAGCGATGQAQNEKKNETEATPQTEAAKTETVETEAADPEEKTTGDSKTLVVYFSYTGHLDSMAHWIADESGADLVRVTAKEAYPEDYDETVDRAKKEQNEDARPEIDIDLTDEQMAEYDTVFFGFITIPRLAEPPILRSSPLIKTTEGVVREPSAFGITVAFPASITATHELPVPRSIPNTLLLII